MAIGAMVPTVPASIMTILTKIPAGILTGGVTGVMAGVMAGAALLYFAPMSIVSIISSVPFWGLVVLPLVFMGVPGSLNIKA